MYPTLPGQPLFEWPDSRSTSCFTKDFTLHNQVNLYLNGRTEAGPGVGNDSSPGSSRGFLGLEAPPCRGHDTQGHAHPFRSQLCLAVAGHLDHRHSCLSHLEKPTCCADA